MKILIKINSGLILLCSFLPSIAFAEPILDKVEVIQTATEADINIDFQTQIRYIRHSPTKESGRIQIFLEFPEYKSLGLALPTEREFLSSPSSKLVPSFIVTFPDQKTNSISIRFKKPVKFRVTPNSSGRGIVVHVPLPKDVEPLAPEVISTPMPQAADTVPTNIPGIPEGMSMNDYASKLIAESRVAIGLAEYSKAIDLLNTVLNLPLNTSSRDAQELIGVAREKNGEYVKAKAEYDLYLKLYPDGEGVARVRKSLETVEAAIKAGKTGEKNTKKETREIHETTIYGSWDQYYYDANSINYLQGVNNSSRHDQSSFVSSLNVTARSQQNEYDTKAVLRDRQTMDFLPGNNHSNRNRLDAAYLEVKNKDIDYLVRLGRQNSNTGGVLGRFDGAWLGYGITPTYHLNLVAGALDEFKVDYKRSFYGINLDIGPVAENWSGNVFYVNQEVKDVTDRRAVGGELRYFDNGKSMYSLLDYDTLYKRLNIAMLQGNWLTEGGTNFNMLIDHRKSPILATVNSLTSSALGGQYETLNQARRAGISEADLRRFAIDNTLQTDTVLFGATRQITPRWQLGGDIQASRTSGVPGASAAAIELFKKRALENGTVLTDQEITNFSNSVNSTGNIWTYHVQAVGTDTIFKGDTSLIGVNYSTSNISRTQSILFGNGFSPAEKWRIDSSLQLLRQDSEPDIVTYLISPTLRTSYRLLDRATLEAEIRFDFDNTDNAGVKSRSLRDAAFLGYRIEF